MQLNIVGMNKLVGCLSENELNHMIRVGILVEVLAAKLTGIDYLTAKLLGEAAFYHDIGKLLVPVNILLKKGKLTDPEMNIIKMHSFHGRTILNEIREGYTLSDKLFRQAIKAILYHHERWDGNGYPFGIKAMQIPFIGRISAVCDAYDAITSIRPYNHKKPYEQACEELERCSGTQFDPELVSVFLRNAVELKSNMQKFEKDCALVGSKVAEHSGIRSFALAKEEI